MKLSPEEAQTLAYLTAACPEMTRLTDHIRRFAQLLVPDPGNAQALEEWITAVRDDSIPCLHAFTRGLDQDRDAIEAALTSEYHNGGTEGVNTRSKLIKRQMYGRAGFALLRHRILLGQLHPPSPPNLGQSRTFDRPRAGCLTAGAAGQPVGLGTQRAVHAQFSYGYSERT